MTFHHYGFFSEHSFVYGLSYPGMFNPGISFDNLSHLEFRWPRFNEKSWEKQKNKEKLSNDKAADEDYLEKGEKFQQSVRECDFVVRNELAGRQGKIIINYCNYFL